MASAMAFAAHCRCRAAFSSAVIPAASQPTITRIASLAKIICGSLSWLLELGHSSTLETGGADQFSQLTWNSTRRSTGCCPRRAPVPCWFPRLRQACGLHATAVPTAAEHCGAADARSCFPTDAELPDLPSDHRPRTSLMRKARMCEIGYDAPTKSSRAEVSRSAMPAWETAMRP